MLKDPGDLSHIFETSVPNLDWLDVDEEAYAYAEKLPKQNLDVVPDLVEAWTHHDMGSIRHVPNIDPDRVREQKWSSNGIDVETLQNTVSQILRSHIMDGWDASKLASWVRSYVPGEYIPKITPILKKIAEERGLLGTVYIDASLWSECDRSQGKKYATIPTVKYVLGKNKCSDCIHNSENRCSVFKKEIVFDVVPYTDDLADEYIHQLKITDSIDIEDPKERIRTAFLSLKNTIDIIDEVKSIENVDAQNQRDRRANQLYTPPSADFKNPHEISLYRDLTHKMMASKGKLSKTVKSRIAHSNYEMLENLKREEHLLGRVYVRPDQFHTCKEAKAFFIRHKISAPYILEMSRCNDCQYRRDKQCSLIDKNITQEISYTKDVLSNELEILIDKNKISKDTAIELLDRADTEDISLLIHEAHAISYVKPVAEYEPKYTTVSMKSTQDVVSATVQDTYTAIPLKHRPVVKAAYKAAYAGIYGKKLKDILVERYGSKSVLEAANHLQPIMHMAGLLGNIILDMRGFNTAQEAGEYIRKTGSRPQYLLKESCGCGGPGDLPDYRENFPAFTVINFGSIGEMEIDAEGIIKKLMRNHRISSETAQNLLSKLDTENPWDLVQQAYLSPKPTPTVPKREIEKHVTFASWDQVKKEILQVTKASHSKKVQEIQNIIDDHLKRDFIPTTVAFNLKSVDLDKVLDVLDIEKKRYAEEKKVKHNLEYISSMREKQKKIQRGDIEVPEIDPKQIVASKKKVISSTMRQSFRHNLIHAMNSGILGDSLKNWIRRSFDTSLIKDQVSYIKDTIQNTGSIGIHYVDPTIYPTCKVGAEKLQKISVKHVKKMSKCDKCVYRTDMDRCQIYNRTLVEDVNSFVIEPEPIEIKKEVSTNNPVIEYGLDDRLENIHINEFEKDPDLELGFDNLIGKINIYE